MLQEAVHLWYLDSSQGTDSKTTCTNQKFVRIWPGQHAFLLRSYNAYCTSTYIQILQIITTQRLKSEHFFCKSRQSPWPLIRFSKTGLRHLGEDLVKDLRPRERLLHGAAGQIKGPRKHPTVSLSFYILSASWLMIYEDSNTFMAFFVRQLHQALFAYLVVFYAHTTPALRKHRKSHKEQRNHLWDV